MIEIHRLSHAYGSLPVLQDLSLQVEDDEILTVLGPSGCGKSTLLRLVGGLERPLSGETRIHPARGDTNSVACIFQDPTLLPWRTAAGNVALPLEHRGLPPGERDRRVAGALARVGLAEFADRFPRDLSGGMRQRVSVARALVVKPAVLLMDEPLASLDEQTRETLLADLVRLWCETPYTGLYVTHSPSEAVRIGHRVVVLTPRPGRIREIVPIDVPIDKRSESHPTIAAARQRIWELVRDPA